MPTSRRSAAGRAARRGTARAVTESCRAAGALVAAAARAASAPPPATSAASLGQVTAAVPTRAAVEVAPASPLPWRPGLPSTSATMAKGPPATESSPTAWVTAVAGTLIRIEATAGAAEVTAAGGSGAGAEGESATGTRGKSIGPLAKVASGHRLAMSVGSRGEAATRTTAAHKTGVMAGHIGWARDLGPSTATGASRRPGSTPKRPTASCRCTMMEQ
mmetsp:Transcript_23778/g.70984  ORF Transcript_23778/g.70984 Transcript_23778/m.70984 type:complete len:218 (-) Transcript_23778:544-1197(-)